MAASKWVHYFERHRRASDENGSLVPRDITITGGQESDADTLEKIIQEVASSRQTERGNREDDKRSESAMEDENVKVT